MAVSAGNPGGYLTTIDDLGFLKPTKPIFASFKRNRPLLRENQATFSRAGTDSSNLFPPARSPLRNLMPTISAQPAEVADPPPKTRSPLQQCAHVRDRVGALGTTRARSDLRQATAAEEVRLGADKSARLPPRRSRPVYFRPTAADAIRDLPLSKRPKRVILAANRPESGNVGLNKIGGEAMRVVIPRLIVAFVLFEAALAVSARAVTIDSYFTANPIRVCNDAGADCATVNTFSAETTKIYAQAGIMPVFLPTTQINSTASQTVSGVAAVNVAGNGQSSNSTVINTWFVKQLTTDPGKVLYGEGYQPGNGVVVNTTDVNSYNGGVGRVDTVAHEIGHNLGLGHTDFGAGGASNLMTAGSDRNIPNGVGNIAPDGTNLDQLTADQITKVRNSPLVKEKPKVVVDTTGSTPFNTNDFFRVAWQSGSTSTYLHSLALNLAPVNAFFDPTNNPPGLDSSPFALSNLVGLSAGDITVAGNTDGSQLLTLTFADNAFNPSDSFNFGIDVDLLSCIDCFGATPSELTGAQFAFNFSDGFAVNAGLGADFAFIADTTQPSATFAGTAAVAGGPTLPPGVLGPTDPVSAPEPGTISLLAAGLAMFGMLRYRRTVPSGLSG
jgi:hypothetical protein